MIISLFYILFIFSAITLVVVILLQEGKGGGFGSALGEQGQQAFGVGASGINRFTAWTAGVFLCSAVLIHVLNRESSETSLLDSEPGISAPIEPGAGTSAEGGDEGN